MRYKLYAGLIETSTRQIKMLKVVLQIRFRLTPHTGRIEIEIPLARFNIFVNIDENPDRNKELSF